MVKVKVIRKTHTRVEVKNGQRSFVEYTKGETFEATDAEFKAFKNRLQRVGAEPEDDDEVDESNLKSLKVPRLKEIAMEEGVEGFANMKKDELVESIEAARKEKADGAE